MAKKKPATTAEKAHMNACAENLCVICSMPCEVHHVRRNGEKRNNFKVIGLCARHHRTGGHGVAIHAGRRSWEANFGLELDYLKQVNNKIKGLE